MIHVIATIRTAANRREEFLRAFRELVPLVHAEQGCLEYGPAVDAETAIGTEAPRADVVTVVEKWESPAALHAHLAAPHMASFRERVKGMVTGIEIRVLAPA
jgi:quinol monooxygenase YgiN